MLKARFEGTHTEPLVTPEATIQPTGKPVAPRFVAISTVEAGVAVDYSLFFDRAELMAQLGLIPAAA